MKSPKIFIAIAVLILVAIGIWLLVGSPFSGQDGSSSQTEMSENDLYRVSIDPELDPIVLNEIHSWIVHVTNQDGEPVENAEITFDGHMVEHGHGLPTAPEVTSALENGEYKVEGMRFSMPGYWIVDITITANGETDTARFDLILD